MNKHLRLIFLLLLLFGINVHVLKAQTDFASEQEFKKQAADLFDKEEFEKAYPLYSQLVSLYRKDPNYNYRLGVCMLYASDEKERAITFLEFAVRSGDAEKEAYFYLAKAYHLNYRFDEAIAQYQAFKKNAASAKVEKLQVDRQIEMCKNGKKLLRNLSDLPVLEKTELGREDFFRSYDINEIGGKLLVKPDEKEFRTPLDKKKNEKSIIFLATNGTEIYFSSYGDNEQSGKDIYKLKKSKSGDWEKPEKLGISINTKFDEDFPFLHPNGKVLYFSSKGHNSMGGYDIFKSTYNEDTKTWNAPVNLDFPINTPDDDILYITNADERKAYFASARSSVAGKISLYHISVERKPIDFAIIKGFIMKNRKNQAVNIKITVKNVSDNTLLGIFNSTATGSYDIKLPNGGSFLFSVEDPDFETQSAVVNISVQKEFRPLQQEISYDLANDKLIVKNLFDEAVNDSNYLLAINVIKEKSRLNVTPVSDFVSNSSSKEDSVSTNELVIAQQSTSTSTSSSPPTHTPTITTTKLSNEDIIKIAYRDANVVDTEATNLREQANIALNFANQKNERAQSKVQEASALMSAASKTEDNLKKQALIDQANASNEEADQLNKETVMAFNLAKKLDATAVSKREEADMSQQYAKGLEVAVNSKNSTKALAELDALEKKLDTLSQTNASNSQVLNSFKKEEESKKVELDKTIQTSVDLKKDIADNVTIIVDLEADAVKAHETKSDREQLGIINQITELKLENSNKQKDLDQNELKIAKLQKEYNGIKNETELVSSVVDQSKTGDSEAAAAKVASIDKNKLEQQINSISNKEDQNKNTKQANETTVASNTTTTNNTNLVSIDTTHKTTSAKTTNTTPKAYLDINNKYAADLASAEKIENEGDREKEKANVLKKWAEAIDDDVEKQKQDYVLTTDPEMKVLLAKKITAAEKTSIEKENQADQSLAKVEALKQPAIAVNTTSEKTIVKDTTPIASSTSEKTISPDTATKTLIDFGKANTDTKNQFTYSDTTANAQIAKANVLNDQANELLAKSIVFQLETVDKTSKSTQKERKKQGDELVKRAQNKKVEAAQLFAKGNETEYISSQNQIQQLAKISSTNSSPELLKAEILNDESQKYFEKAKELRKKANSNTAYYSKETDLEAAKDNERIALDKQKESFEIYKNYNPNAVTSYNANTHLDTIHNNTYAISATDVVKNNPLPVKDNTAVKPNTSATAIIDINKKYSTDLAAAEKIPNESDREKAKAELLKKWADDIDKDVDKQRKDFNATTDPDMKALLGKKISDAQNSSKEKQLQADQSIAKVETLKQQNSIVSINTPKPNTNENNSTIANNSTTTNTNQTENKTIPAETGRHVVTREVITSNENTKANLLNNQADTLENYSAVLKSKAENQTNEDSKKLMLEQSDDIHQQSREKKFEAAKLDAVANRTEYTTNQKQLDEYSKTFASNNSDEISMAGMMSDEALIYFEKAKTLRSKADTTKSYDKKESLLANAKTNEMIALEKQKKSSDIYKNYKPTVAATTIASTSPTKTIPLPTSNIVASNPADVSTASAVNKTTGDNATLPVNSTKTEPIHDATSITKTIEPVNTTISTSAAEVKYTYLEPIAIEQISKAELLNKQAGEKVEQSVDLKSVAVKESNIDTKNRIYSQSEELIDDAQDKKLQASKLIATANTTEYSANQNHLDQLAKATSSNTAADILKAEILNDEGKTYFENAKKQRLQAGSIDLYSSKETILDEAGKNETQALVKQKEAFDIYKKYNPDFVASTVNPNNTATNNLLSSNATTMNHAAPSPSLNTNPTIGNTNLHLISIDIATPANEISSDITLSPSEVFDQKSAPVYSINNPIPINEKLPEGLIFKVQIGAFRNPIPQDLFQGMSPITGETTAKGFIRYTAGLFKKYNTADKVKNKIVGLGYKDAFVVAFLDGKRIPINEAYAMAGGTPATVLQIRNPLTNATQNAVASNPDITSEQPKEIVKSQNVSGIHGLFYTVQVGVFSQPVLAERVYSMRPLYNETAPNGYIRYYTGIYKSVTRATEAKEIVNDIGIKDAFVTAYYNGKRISMPEAKQYETQGEDVFSNDPNLNKLPVFTANARVLPKPNLAERKKVVSETNNGVPVANANTSANSTETQQPEENEGITIVDITNPNEPVIFNEAAKELNTIASQNNKTIVDPDLVFKVQIGAFYDEVPVDMANKFLKIARLGIKNYKDNTGLTFYTVGNLKSYEEANLLKNEVVEESITDAFIVAYRNGEKIPLEEARKIK